MCSSMYVYMLKCVCVRVRESIISPSNPKTPNICICCIYKYEYLMCVPEYKFKSSGSCCCSVMFGMVELFVWLSVRLNVVFCFVIYLFVIYHLLYVPVCCVSEMNYKIKFFFKCRQNKQQNSNSSSSLTGRSNNIIFKVTRCLLQNHFN